MNDIKNLGLEARQLRLQKKVSYETLYCFFMTKFSEFRRKDLVEFNKWLRSVDGINPYHKPTQGIATSIYPYVNEIFPENDFLSFEKTPYVCLPLDHKFVHDEDSPRDLKCIVKSWTPSLKAYEKVAKLRS